MKWKTPQIGEEKLVKNKFLLFPMTIGTEVRWLERVDILYRYHSKRRGWLPCAFVDPEQMNRVVGKRAAVSIWDDTYGVVTKAKQEGNAPWSFLVVPDSPKETEFWKSFSELYFFDQDRRYIPKSKI